MAAWIDTRCTRCDRRFGYIGDVARPQTLCPTCKRTADSDQQSAVSPPAGSFRARLADRPRVAPEISNRKSPINNASGVVMPYGKYRGKTLGAIADTDLRYLDWLNGTEIRSPQLQLAVAAIAANYAHEIDNLVGD